MTRKRVYVPVCCVLLSTGCVALPTEQTRSTSHTEPSEANHAATKPIKEVVLDAGVGILAQMLRQTRQDRIEAARKQREARMARGG